MDAAAAGIVDSPESVPSETEVARDNDPADLQARSDRAPGDSFPVDLPDLPGIPAITAEPPPAPPGLECPRRLPFLRIDACNLCGGRDDPFQVFGCQTHGECSFSRKHSNVRACRSCPDLPAAIVVSDDLAGAAPSIEPPRRAPRTTHPNTTNRSKREPLPSPSHSFLTGSNGRDATCLHDSYRGASCFLIGGGPSLNSGHYDLSKLHQRGILLAAMNNAAVVIRPHIWFCVDIPGNFHEVILRDPGIDLKFVKAKQSGERLRRFNAATGAFESIADAGGGVAQCPGVWFYSHSKDLDPTNFLTIPAPTWGHDQHRSVMLVALRILYWLGVRKVYLLGCDFRMTEEKSYAFDDNQPAGRVAHNNSKFKLLNKFFRDTEPHLRAHGFEVYNAAHPKDSDLTAFEWIDFDLAIAQTLAGFPQEIVTRGHYIQ